MSPDDPRDPASGDGEPGPDPNPFETMMRQLGGLFGNAFGDLSGDRGTAIPGLPGAPGIGFGGPFGPMGAGSGGPAGGDPARQIAMAAASEGNSEPNVEPTVRMEYEALVRVAELQVADRTGLTVARSGRLEVQPVTRTVWASKSVDAYRPYLSKMAHFPTDGLADDPSLSWISDLMASMAPMLAAVTTGTMVGRLAQRSLGSYDLPIPRPLEGPDADALLVVAPNVDAFSADWSLPAEDLRLWICLHEVAHHAVLGVGHFRDAMGDLLARHAGAFRNEPTDLGGLLGDVGLDPNDLDDPNAAAEALAGLQQALDPDAVLEAVRSPEQEALLPSLESLVALVVGVVDHVMDEVGSGLIGSYRQVTEALRRRRVTTSDADRFVEKILGIDLTQAQVDRGAAFIDGVVEREGDSGLARLWTGPEALPTPAELDAPGLWLARLDLGD
ncbi:MAG: zinc-dependent metalloprotease [Actinomycetota bacterium]|nr:zinc-dependent metalloprotease [Actinomycetota bacterium]